MVCGRSRRNRHRFDGSFAPCRQRKASRPDAPRRDSTRSVPVRLSTLRSRQRDVISPGTSDRRALSGDRLVLRQSRDVHGHDIVGYRFRRHLGPKIDGNRLSRPPRVRWSATVRTGLVTDGRRRRGWRVVGWFGVEVDLQTRRTSCTAPPRFRSDTARILDGRTARKIDPGDSERPRCWCLVDATVVFESERTRCPSHRHRWPRLPSLSDSVGRAGHRHGPR